MDSESMKLYLSSLMIALKRNVKYSMNSELFKPETNHGLFMVEEKPIRLSYSAMSTWSWAGRARG